MNWACSAYLINVWVGLIGEDIFGSSGHTVSYSGDMGISNNEAIPAGDEMTETETYSNRSCRTGLVKWSNRVI